MDKTGASTYSAEEVAAALLGMADQRQAQMMLRFFKTGPGEYGEGDQFIGLKNPQVRLVVKEAWRHTPLAEAVKLVKSPLHEVRLCGLFIMVEIYLRAMKKGDASAMAEVFNAHACQHEHINNWDLVDLSATKIVGNHEAQGGRHPLMEAWIKPGHTLWQHRISMVSAWMLIRKALGGVAFERAAYLLGSPHDLLHKAAGWMLREAWKHGYKDDLRRFLDAHVGRMPAVMLSYVCEQMPVDERHRWQQERKRRFEL